MKVGVIGYGSIGKRHISNLFDVGIKDVILLREKGKGNELGLMEVQNLEELMQHSPEFVVIANPTALHFKYLVPLMKNNVNILAEKPLVYKENEQSEILTLINNYGGTGMTAFNLRFHPCIQKSQELIKQNHIGRLYHSHFFVGQYLPDWRPISDYRNSYSAKKELGGGVLFDLIHELDLSLLFCDEPTDRLSSLIGNFGDLAIETEDLVEINYVSAKKIAVNIHLDYLTRGVKRHFQLFGTSGHISCDLVTNTVKLFTSKKGEEEFKFAAFERNHMYLDLMKHFLYCLKEKKQPITDLSSGLRAGALALRSLKNNIIQ